MTCESSWPAEPGHRASSGAATGGPRPSGNGDDDERGKLGLLEQLGAEGVVMDGLDAASVGEAVAAARPDAIVNQMTALSEAHAGKPNLRRADRFFAITNRLRSEGIDHLLAAAEATGVAYVVSQGHASMNGVRQAGWVKTEEDPLEVLEGTKAITHLEDAVVSEAAPSCGTAGSTGRAPTTIRSSS